MRDFWLWLRLEIFTLVPLVALCLGGWWVGLWMENHP